MTMTLADIETALGKHLAAMPNALEIAWPNLHVDPVRPFLAFQHVPVSWTDLTLDGVATVAAGYIVVTVVTTQGNFATDANEIASKVMAHFRYGLELAAGTGKVTVMQPPGPLVAVKDMADWRQPVRVDYEAEALG